MKNKNYKNYNIYHFHELASTNETAYEMALKQQAVNFDIIIADKQSAGKGRNLRKWHSPIGNLYFSLVLQPNLEINKIPQISFLAITALRLAIAKIANKNLAIENKWPNDLLINQKKVAGLLLESYFSHNKCNFVIIGIGVNINSNPENTIFPASNLQEFAINNSATQVLELFLDEFSEIYQNYQNFGFKGIRNLWLKEAYLLGKEIKVKNGNEEISGIFENLDEDGNLLLKVGSEIKKILAADVF